MDYKNLPMGPVAARITLTKQLETKSVAASRGGVRDTDFPIDEMIVVIDASPGPSQAPPDPFVHIDDAIGLFLGRVALPGAPRPIPAH